MPSIGDLGTHILIQIKCSLVIYEASEIDSLGGRRHIAPILSTSILSMRSYLHLADPELEGYITPVRGLHPFYIGRCATLNDRTIICKGPSRSDQT